MTVLRETSQIVLASLLATAPSFALTHYWLWLVHMSPEHVPRAIIAISTSVLACTASWVASCLKWPSKGKIVKAPILFQSLVSWRRGDEAASLFVTLKNGTSWRGVYAGHDTGPEATDPHIAIKTPLSRRRADRDWQHFKGPQVTVIPLSEIESIRIVNVTMSNNGALSSGDETIS